jgi:uncharacterized damage-inducible protein DinB
MDAAKARIEEAISGLSDAEASRREIDGWSVKDHLAHMTLWHEMRFFELSRVARGGTFTFPESEDSAIDALNEQFAEKRRALSLEQVVADLEYAREMVRQGVQSAPDERLDFSLYGEIGPHGAGHDTEHAEVIIGWRKREGI